MLLSEIHIRDPFVLPHDGTYYLFGTHSEPEDKSPCFYCWTSKDLLNWCDAIWCFQPSEDFWADTNFWAPEVHLYRGKFYMFASFYVSDKSKMRATHILAADKPEGPYAPFPEPATPREWMCLDGTLYVDNGIPYIVYCHEWLLAAMSRTVRFSTGLPMANC